MRAARGGILNANDKAFAHRLKRGLELPELRSMGHLEQAVDLRQMPAETPCKFRPHPR